uniref:Uncharacterized protein LOC111134983 n=1 Tax=Crassostrea virginica TaxID=6565 RepID=A0A8B8EL27_CRAVI|nr:uncharacterized protein LOC111134983 [Crassostrea virginica]
MPLLLPTYIVLIFGTNMAFGLYGGGACTIPATDPPGMSTLCTAQANGFCLVNTIDLKQQTTTGTGVCICYPGYSGTMCAVKSNTATTTGTTSSSTSSSTSGGAGALGGLAALALLGYFLSQSSGGLFGSGSSSAVTPQEAAYIRQATAY